ncbi:MAG: hypothetical protein M3067_10480 [Chloroflexota bacterium]|nr:hypothetical protein [Chloroflexota bacterium]
MTPRVAALVFAVLLVAPSVAAAPAPAMHTRSALAGAPAKSSWVSSNRAVPKPTVHSRGKIDPMKLPKVARPTGVKSTWPKLRLPFAAAAAAAGPKVGGPLTATVFAGPPTANPAIAGPALPGLNAGTPSTSVEPPDAFVAVGPEHVVQTVNSAIRMQRRQGESLVDTPLTTFFGIDPTHHVSDARVIYDSLHARWLAIQVEYDCSGNPALPFSQGEFGHGYIDVALSDTADPTRTWTGWYLQFDDYLADYPGLGTSTDKIAIASNIFPFTSSVCDGSNFGPYRGNEIDFADWGQMLAGGDSQGNITIRSRISDNTIFATRPALQTPATSSTIFAVDVTTSGPASDVGWVNFTGSVPADTVAPAGQGDLTTSSALPAFGDPHPPVQPGGVVTSVDGTDGRPTDAVWQGNRLIFTATTTCTPPGDSAPRDCVRVTELATGIPSATPTLRQDFNLGALGQDFYFGGIGLSLNGSLHVTYTRSSAAVYPSGYAVYQLPTDATNRVSAAELVLGGDPVKYAGSRWGDYMGVATDPQAPGTAWRTNQASNVSGTWKTNIGALNTDFGSTYVPIDPVRVLDTRIGLGLSGRFQSKVARTFQIAGVGSPAIPASAVAITGNVVEVQQTAAGYVSVTPRPINKPTSSTVNFPLGDTRANNVTTPLGPGGTLSATYDSATAGKFTHLVFDVTGYFVPGATGAGHTPVTATRLLDSRDGTGGYSTPFAMGVPRNFPVWTQGGVPVNAVAVTGNLTVTRQSSGGFVTLGPVSVADPPTSNLNYKFGDDRANGVSVKLSSTGELWAVFRATSTSARADVIFDVTGYYMAAGAGYKYFPLNPGRIMDTRPGAVLSGLSGAQAGTTTTGNRALDTAGHWGVPLDAKAITGNLTVTQPTKNGLIAIKKAAGDALTSTLNFPAGDTRANGMTMPLNDLGDMLLLYRTAGGGTTHLILDITGYFR